MEFWLSGSLSHELFFFHDAILATRKPFTRTFLFSQWNSGYQETFSHEFFFFHDGILAIRKPFLTIFFSFTMEFWLSGSLSHELFFFHDGILAIRKPFTQTFLFSRWNSGYQEAFHTNFSFFTMEFWLSGSLSHEVFFFHDGILEICNLGEDSFHIYITKSIFIGSASLKTLPLDLEPPLQGKEYGPPYSNATKKRKASVFFRNHL
jgi:hypothetical protein